MSTSTVTHIDIQGKLPKVASGKVRDLYAIDDNTLLFVASDRISAYDVIMENVSPRVATTTTRLVFLRLMPKKPKTSGHPRKRRTSNCHEHILVQLFANPGSGLGNPLHLQRPACIHLQPDRAQRSINASPPSPHPAY